MEQQLSSPTFELDEHLQKVANLIIEHTNEYSLGVNDVLANHNVDNLIRVANDPYAHGSVFEAIGMESFKFMRLLVLRFEVLYPDLHKDTIEAEAAKAVEMTEQTVIANKIFEKVASEIDSSTGLSDATCSNLASYNPRNQKIVMNMVNNFYSKYVDDHKAGKDARIIQHNGEAFGHIGGELEVTVAGKKGIDKSISLDEYKLRVLVNDRAMLKEKLKNQSDPDAAASLRAIEDIPVHAYNQRFEDSYVPSQIGKSLSTFGQHAQAASVRAGEAAYKTSTQAVQIAHKTSKRVATIDHKKVSSTAALFGVAGTFGIGGIESASAQVTTTAHVSSTLYAASQANSFPKSVISEVDGGLVVMASPISQLTAVTLRPQEVIAGGVIIAQESVMALPVNPQPVHNILQVRNESVQKEIDNAVANGNVMAGALALSNSTSEKPVELSMATPVHATIDRIDTALANATVIPEIAIEVRNMLIVAGAASVDPDVLNTIDLDQWNVIKGGQDSAETQAAISKLTGKYAILLAQPNSGLNSESTPDQLTQEATLLASSEFFTAYKPSVTTSPEVAPVTPAQPPANPNPKPKTSEHPSGLPESAKVITPEVVHKMLPHASRSTIDKNYGLIMKALAERGISDPKMVLYAFSTINVETSSFKPIPEWGKGEERYRTSTGDYYGRGFVQLTWESNYRKAGKALGIDLVHNPDLALDPEVAAKIFAWFLTAGNHEDRIRDALNGGDLAAARAVVNGGTNGLQGFSESYDVGLKAVQATKPSAPAPTTPVPVTPPAPTTPPDVAADPTIPPETSVAPIDSGEGLVIPTQASNQSPDSVEDPEAPNDTPPATQPAVASPVPEAPAIAKDTPEAAKPVTVEAQRSSEIAQLKSSGRFNQSQAMPDAPRSPLEKISQQQGENNGQLRNVVELGPQWPNMKLSKPAAESFLKMNDAFKAQFGHDIILNDSYRDYDNQVAVKQDATRKGRPQFAATPGYSKHGWGIAFDGGENLQSFDSDEYKWMLANALDHGWNHPAFAAPDTDAPEPWHWEYVLSQ